METALKFVFRFKVGDRPYSFERIATTEAEALKLLDADLQEILLEIRSKA